MHEKVGQIIKIINPSEVLEVYDHGGGDDDDDEDYEAPEVQSMMFSSTGIFKQAMPDMRFTDADQTKMSGRDGELDDWGDKWNKNKR